MKNANGTGSVYKLKGKRRNPWVAIATTGYTIDGKQVRKVIGTFKTRKEADNARIEFLNNPELFSKKTFKDIRELWWNNYIKKNKTGTLIANENRLKHLTVLDSREIADIKLLELQSLFDSMQFSSSFKKCCKSVLNMIFEFALKNDFINSNKVRFVEIEKTERKIERKIFTKEEIEQLWNHSDNLYANLTLILIYTGMRIGELLNLKNADINFEERFLNIRTSKTTNGVRIIPIHSKIFPLFTKNLRITQEYFLQAENGKQLSYASFKAKYIKEFKKMGIEYHTIHSTRHTFATLMSNAEANKTAIKNIIGHSNYSMTEKVYTHKDKDELRKAIEMIQ